MKKFFYVVILALGAFAFYKYMNPTVDFAKDEPNSVQFIKNDFNAALAKAKTENKLVFVDFYATWCGPCKMLKKNTFTNPDIANQFNEKYINVSIDLESQEGMQVAGKYGITGLPTLAFINAEGEVIKKSVGYISASDLQSMATGL